MFVALLLIWMASDDEDVQEWTGEVVEGDLTTIRMKIRLTPQSQVNIGSIQ